MSMPWPHPKSKNVSFFFRSPRSRSCFTGFERSYRLIAVRWRSTPDWFDFPARKFRQPSFSTETSEWPS